MKSFNLKSLFSSKGSEEKDTSLNRQATKKENINIVTKVFPVTGMSCSSCVKHIQTALNDQNGVISAEVNLPNSNVKIEYDPEVISTKDLKATVENAGYNLVIE